MSHSFQGILKSLEEHTTNLTKIKLDDSGIGDTEALVLADALIRNPPPQPLKLRVTGNKISDEGAQALAQILRSNISLRGIILWDNKIGDTGAQALAQVLKTNTSLQNLNLGMNKIGHSGAEALAQALITNTSLQKLNLGENYIGDQGAQALSQALVTNTSLQTLYLWDNKIGEQGVRALGQSLLINSSFQNLYIECHHYPNLYSQRSNLLAINRNHIYYQEEYDEKNRKRRTYHSIVL